MYDKTREPEDGEIAYLLRQMGCAEGRNTTLHRGGKIYDLLDDGTVTVNGIVISQQRGDAFTKRKAETGH